MVLATVMFRKYLCLSSYEIRFYEVGHYPQLQSPELVIEAIQDVLRRREEKPESAVWYYFRL
jgi:hypothetical protein